jgi:hypothetical protein
MYSAALVHIRTTPRCGSRLRKRIAVDQTYLASGEELKKSGSTLRRQSRVLQENWRRRSRRSGAMTAVERFSQRDD